MSDEPALGATVTSLTSEGLRRKVCLTSELYEQPLQVLHRSHTGERYV